MHDHVNLILAFHPNMAYYMTCYNAWTYVNIYKAITEFKIIKITSQKPIFNIITKISLVFYINMYDNFGIFYLYLLYVIREFWYLPPLKGVFGHMSIVGVNLY